MKFQDPGYRAAADEVTIQLEGLHSEEEFQQKMEAIKLQVLAGAGDCDRFTEVRQYSAGDSFGEGALINSKPRAATVQGTAPCFLAVMDKESYKKSLGKIERKQKDHLIQFFKDCPIFQHWSRGALYKLIYHFKKHRFRRGHIVYQKGEVCKQIYFVYQGVFEQVKQIHLQREEHEADLYKYLHDRQP